MQDSFDYKDAEHHSTGRCCVLRLRLLFFWTRLSNSVCHYFTESNLLRDYGIQLKYTVADQWKKIKYMCIYIWRKNANNAARTLECPVFFMLFCCAMSVYLKIRCRMKIKKITEKKAEGLVLTRRKHLPSLRKRICNTFRTVCIISTLRGNLCDAIMGE